MQFKIIEATNLGAGGINYGKFMVSRFDHEWSYLSELDRRPLLRAIGWDITHVFVTDLQTGEGAMFKLGGLASADLNKHAIHVCPLFENFLTWLYKQTPFDLDALPSFIEIDDPASALAGYRRPGNQSE